MTIEQTKGQLLSHFVPKCQEVFRRLPPAPINNDAKAFYRLVVAVVARVSTGCAFACLTEQAH